MRTYKKGVSLLSLLVSFQFSSAQQWAFMPTGQISVFLNPISKPNPLYPEVSGFLFHSQAYPIGDCQKAISGGINLIQYDSGFIWFHVTCTAFKPIRFYPDALPGTGWNSKLEWINPPANPVPDMIYNFFCDSVKWNTFNGITDSIKYLHVSFNSGSPNWPVILSKTYGLLQFPNFEQIRTSHTEVIENKIFSVRQGNTVKGSPFPKAQQFLNIQVGSKFFLRYEESNTFDPDHPIYKGYLITNTITNVTNLGDSLLVVTYDSKQTTHFPPVTWYNLRDTISLSGIDSLLIYGRHNTKPAYISSLQSEVRNVTSSRPVIAIRNNGLARIIYDIGTQPMERVWIDEGRGLKLYSSMYYPRAIFSSRWLVLDSAQVVLSTPEPADSPADFFVYPNPVRHELFIKSGLTSLQKATLTDITGKMIKENIIDNPGIHEVSMTVEGLPAGIYFLLVELDTGSGVQKVIIQ